MRRRELFRRAAAAGGLALAGCVAPSGRSERWPAWPSSRRDPPRLETHPDVTNPVLGPADVDGLSEVDVVADPFLVPWGDQYHLFFEIAHEGGEDIGHARSSDGLSWEYTGRVLDESGHLAYPFVSRIDGEWFMFPDRGYVTNGMRIYRAREFPTDWELFAHTLTDADEMHGDPTPVYWNDRWYVFFVRDTGPGSWETSLYHASTLTGPWTEHPESPVHTDDRQGRPAGRPVLYGDSLDLFYQDTVRTYGDKTRAFRVTELTPDSYEDRERSTSPVVQSTGDEFDWRHDGMHHVDAGLAATGGPNVVAVDGKDVDGVWRIGLYRLG